MINGNECPYGESEAARLLRDGLQNYTRANAGGLRALAARLEIKQAASLSHMATGRMAIPMDRAAMLASVLELDVATFCFAVLKQRAPSAYAAIEDWADVAAVALKSPQARRAIGTITKAPSISEEQAQIISEVVTDRMPVERWLRIDEVPMISVIRDLYPEGLTLRDLDSLHWAIELAKELDL